MLIYLNFQQNNDSLNRSTRTGIVAVESQFDILMKRFFKASLFSAVVFAFFGPLISGLTLVLRIWIPAYITKFGLYIAPAVFVSSCINFVSYMIFMNDFRKEVKTLLFNLSRLCGNRDQDMNVITVSRARCVQDVAVELRQIQ